MKAAPAWHEKQMATLRPSEPDADRAEPLGPEDTLVLVARVKKGDEDARNRLVERCIPPLRRWARGRLPASQRAWLDEGSLVEQAVVAAMNQLEAFEPRHQGALQAYLRQAVRRRIYDVIRQHERRPRRAAANDGGLDDATSQLDRLIGTQNVERYEEALAQLRPDEREALIGRMEMRYTYAELAVVLDKPTADAARIAVTRACKRLAELLAEAAPHA